MAAIEFDTMRAVEAGAPRDPAAAGTAAITVVPPNLRRTITNRIAEPGQGRTNLVMKAERAYAPHQRMTVHDAFAACDLLRVNYAVKPLCIEQPDGTFGKTRYGQVVASRDEFASWHTVGDPVLDTFPLLQNTMLARALEPLAVQYPMEVVGSAHEDGMIFVTFKLPNFAVHGDEHRSYVRFIEGKGGKAAFRAFITSVRMYCTNTIIPAFSKAVHKIELRHDGRFLEDVGVAAEAMLGITTAHGEMVEQYAAFGRTRVSGREAEDFFLTLYPDPAKPRRLSNAATVDQARLTERQRELLGDTRRSYDLALENARSLRTLAWERLGIFNASHPTVAGSPYALYQVSAELEDARAKGGNGAFDSITSGEGHNRRIKAWKLTAELAGVAQS